MQDVNDCIVCVEISYESRVHFIGKSFLYSNANKNINIYEDVKFHGLSEYVLTFQKISSFDNNILKIQSKTYFFQGYIWLFVYYNRTPRTIYKFINEIKFSGFWLF